MQYLKFFQEFSEFSLDFPENSNIFVILIKFYIKQSAHTASKCNKKKKVEKMQTVFRNFPDFPKVFPENEYDFRKCGEILQLIEYKHEKIYCRRFHSGGIFRVFRALFRKIFGIFLVAGRFYPKQSINLIIKNSSSWKSGFFREFSGPDLTGTEIFNRVQILGKLVFQHSQYFRKV